MLEKANFYCYSCLSEYTGYNEFAEFLLFFTGKESEHWNHISHSHIVYKYNIKMGYVRFSKCYIFFLA